MKYNLNHIEKQEIILKRLRIYDEKGTLDLFHELQDEMTDSDVLDNFVVQAMMIVEEKYNKTNPNHKRGDLAEYFIRQYSNAERLPIRLTIYRILK